MINPGLTGAGVSLTSTMMDQLQTTLQQGTLPKPQTVNQAAIQATNLGQNQDKLHGMRQELLQLRAHVRGAEQELASKGHQMPPQMREAIKRDLDAAHQKLDQLVDRILNEMPHLKQALTANAQAIAVTQMKLMQASLMPGGGADVGKIRDELNSLANERSSLMGQIAPETNRLQDAVLEARHDLRRVMGDLQRTPPGPQRDHLMHVRDQASDRLSRAMEQLESTLPSDVRGKFNELRTENRELHETAMKIMAQLHANPGPPTDARKALERQLESIFADQRDNARQMDKMLGF